jgi:hypothetical protein
MNDPKLDLGPLDPARDQVRWERLVRSVAARGAAGADRRRPGRLALQLAAWLRPALACAAALAVVAWVPAWLHRGGPPTAAATAPTADRASRLAAWATSDEAGGAGAFLAAIGDDDDAR